MNVKRFNVHVHDLKNSRCAANTAFSVIVRYVRSWTFGNSLLHFFCVHLTLFNRLQYYLQLGIALEKIKTGNIYVYVIGNCTPTCAIFLLCPRDHTMKAFIGRFTWSLGSALAPWGSCGLYAEGHGDWCWLNPGELWPDNTECPGDNPGCPAGDNLWWSGCNEIGDWLTVSGGE